MSLEEKNIDKPRTKPAEVRLEELMNAAETLFLEKGFDATTVSDIVKQAGVAKGTYYHYFTAKTDILDALRTRYMDWYIDKIEQAMASCQIQDFRAKLKQWIVDAYALCLSACILSSGPLSDRFGRKKVWLWGGIIFTLGSL
ncbi:TetR/AcrR family transcriptional regulator, partial [Proteus mirabilis]|uniref:TetR/AcrR family transcriptional regulator n=1 Tax=Proteus mirabilis TaxID=584 RepID=UPI001FD7563E